MKVVLELAFESRIDDLLPHFRTYQAGCSQFSATSEEQTRDFLLDLLRNPSSGFVVLATIDALIVGFATGFATISGVLAARVIHLGDLYVDPAHRGSNIGGQLMEEVRAEAARRGIELVRWLSVASNDKLNRWYQATGARVFDFKLFITDAKKG
ncbi:MAG TPA: GNAT family N-acetyltransferase [Opitutus sp.]|nr:GNAT family N-acetyltransferase [Opitutus sp.]